MRCLHTPKLHKQDARSAILYILRDGEHQKIITTLLIRHKEICGEISLCSRTCLLT
jgi:hypothetical protein